ncbi:U11/U12 small nuclear ribonucleoprotein 35 kDa protein-like [Aricia agestis]|uniref:U11/U12 small nuclear ribonucleoprotein 35 kDa protein-like n=1 Tax=Aricia agestis TaxID=91739 RepID=UPI001C20C40D|nr:U11/U12 small nuclear ribonucleoprotein 35 kDa protein-like [Aricia agestis]
MHDTSYDNEDNFRKYAAKVYDPIKIGSIDGTDTEPHDRGILRALSSEYVPNKLVKGDPHHTIFVARLNPRTTQETIVKEFSKFGKIVHCRLVKDIVTGKSKQYAFVEFEKTSAADRAFYDMHKEYIDNTEVIVEKEAERRLQGWKPRRLGGGFGGRKESGQLRFGCRDRPFRKPIIVPKNLERRDQK